MFITYNPGGQVGIGEYTTSGAVVNSRLVGQLNGPTGIAISGGNLFVAFPGVGLVGEWSESGAAINSELIQDFATPQGIAVLTTPEPSSLVMLGLGTVALWFVGRRRRA
jgi:hypothetical protein